jgi:hypothetical protein
MIETPQLLLPFAEREYVDMRRCARIFGASNTAVYRMAATLGFDGKPLISMVEYRRGAHRRILYSSIVRYCDHLRERYRIADRRPPKNPMLRHRDEDLLPFPLTDTVYSPEALAALGYQQVASLVPLIEEGRFDAYKLVSGKEWRISRSSLIAYIESLRDKPSRFAVPYKLVAGPPKSNKVSDISQASAPERPHPSRA